MRLTATHYDNLKVSRDAPVEVIRAAYKSLSQKYHPDKSSDPDSARIMRLINEAYAVLSDPARRREHDDWIARRESETDSQRQDSSPSDTIHQPSSPKGRVSAVTSMVTRNLPYYAVAIMVILVAIAGERPQVRTESRDLDVSEEKPTQAMVAPLSNETGATAVEPAAYTSEPAIVPRVSEPEYVRGCLQISKNAAMPIFRCTMSTGLIMYTDKLPIFGKPRQSASQGNGTSPDVAGQGAGDYFRPSTAPNGSPWPEEAGYVNGYPRLNMNGHSKLVVDNSRNDADVYVKVMDVTSSSPRTVRNFFIPAGQSFKSNGYAPGRYDLRYRDLQTGALFRTESFQLEEYQSESDLAHSIVTMTLYKVEGGNMETFAIDEDQFGEY